jgi:uncharacterized protein (TIGR01440 family)
LEKYAECANLSKGDIFIVGCSTSEVLGDKIGTNGSEQCATAIFETVNEFCKKHGLFLAAQCCEHLNRAIIIEKKALLPGTEIVNAVPQLHAGGSFAVTCYENFEQPVAVEHIKADAGLDIGDTLIGMHLKDVAVPVRLKLRSIGEAHLVAARTRPKYIGGERAVYDMKLAGRADEAPESENDSDKIIISGR